MMQGKVCLITGANRGIGRATAEGLARLGATVIMVCRDRAAGEQARQEIVAATGNAQVEMLVADLSVQAEVKALAEDVRARHKQLHLLISNAASYFNRRTTTVDSVEATFAVNHLAGFILISELIDVMKASAPARIVLVASDAHQRVTDPEDWESNKGYNSLTAYSRSKLANVMFCYDLAHRLEGTGITVNSCHPGLVDSELLQEMYNRWWSSWFYPFVKRFLTITAEQGAETVLYLAASADVEGVTGKYFRKRSAATSSLISHDSVLGARLWNISLRLTGELPPVTITGEIIASH
jgi:NAD(P)-dependent dehydrogenase (short-subunit alcohol dehydrogenase family)